MHYLVRSLINETARRRFSVKASLWNGIGFSSDDASYILDRVNNINDVSGTLIGTGNKKKLEDHIKQKGEFKVLDDVLLVHGLGPKSVKRICDKLLSVRGDGEENVAVETTKRFRLPVITPPLSESQTSMIKTVGSVNIGTNEVTWAKINCVSKNLEVWDSLSLDSQLTLKRLDLISFISLSKNLVERLPPCDIYVLEDLNMTGYGGSQPRTILTSVIAALVHQPPTGGVPRVALISGRAVARWSGRLVGSEKVSSQSVIADIIIKLEGSTSGASLNGANGVASLPILYAEPALRSAYLNSQPASREALADAVLLALAFMDLALRRKESVLRPS